MDRSMASLRALGSQQADRLRRRWQHDRDRVESLAVLAPLLTPYTPWSSSAMRPPAVRELCNDVVVNGRVRVLELGAGVSSIVLCRLADRLGLDTRIHSVDEDGAWLDRIGSLLSPAELDHWAAIDAPLTSGTFDDGTTFARWYDPAPITASLDGPIDLVVVDGPSAYRPEWADDRSGALPFTRGRLAPSHSVVIDDTDRQAERALARRWQAATADGYLADRLDHCWLFAGGSLNVS